MNNNDYLDGELNSLEKENLELRASSAWLFAILCIEAGVSLLYLAFNKVIFPIICPIGDDNYVNKSTFLYGLIGILVTLVLLVFYTIGAVKIRNTGYRIGLIIMGVLHIATFLIYQFVR